MKNIAIIIFAFISIGLSAQQQRPQKVISFVDVTWRSDYYEQLQYEWEALVKKDKKDANAWENYYLAAMYKLRTSNYYKDTVRKGSREELHQIIKEMGKEIPDTYEYNRLVFRDNDLNPKYGKYLERAYELRPTEVELYPTLITYYEMIRDTGKKAEIYRKWYDLDSDFKYYKLALGYNSLMSVEKNAIILSHGDDQTYPVELVKFGLGIREDVDVIYQSMFHQDTYYSNLLSSLNMPPLNKTIKDFEKEYADTNSNYLAYYAVYGLMNARIKHFVLHTKDRPLYFPIQLKKIIKSQFEDSLYLVGTYYKYSTEQFDNIAILKRNFEQKFLLDNLKIDLKKVPENSTQYRLQTLYFTPLLELYKHYISSGDLVKTESTKQMILKLAKDYGKESEYLEYLSGLEKQLNP